MTTHKREVWPFERAPDAFETTAMRIDGGSDFDAGEAIFIIRETDTDDPEALDIELRFDVEADLITEKVGLPTSRVDVAVVLEQSSVRSSKVLSRWNVEDVPRYWEHSLPPEEVTSRTEIRLVAILNDSRENTGSGAAWRKASLLAERTFVVRRPVSETLFPVQNTSFESRDWDENALWYVEYDSPDDAHQLRPSEVFSVHLNSDLDALNHLWLKSTPRRGSIPRVMANMVRKMVVAGLIGDVSVALLGRFHRLRKDDPGIDPEPESTVEMLLEFLKSSLKKPEDDILKMAASDEGELRRAIQDTVECGKAFGIEPLHRIRDVE